MANLLVEHACIGQVCRSKKQLRCFCLYWLNSKCGRGCSRTVATDEWQDSAAQSQPGRSAAEIARQATGSLAPDCPVQAGIVCRLWREEAHGMTTIQSI